MNIKIILGVLIFSCLSKMSFGQSHTGSYVTGKIVDDKDHKPVEFANIGLFNTKDSSLFSGTVTDIDGEFIVENINVNHYYVQISCIGYESLIIPNINIKSNSSNIDLGTNSLTISSIALGSVNITSSKSVLNNSIDKKVYNVDKDILGQTGSVSDVLQNIPSVSVDIDGTVELRGSTDVTFFINGKPSTLLNKNSATVLQQIPSNSIDRIEVITNPSSKYKPDGTGGIINIVLKKDKQEGFNGMFLANVGNKNRYNSSIYLNYNRGKYNLFANYGFRQNNSPRLSTDYRINRDSSYNVINYYNSLSESTSKPYSHIGSFGIDYQINDNNKLELSANANFQNKHRLQETHSIWTNPDQVISNDYLTERVNDESETEWEVSTLWEHQFPKEDHILQFELNLSRYNEIEDNIYTDYYFMPEIAQDLSRMLIKKNGPKAEFYAEYTLPINENSEFGSGYVFESFKDNLTYIGENYDNSTGLWVNDINKSNDFISTQNAHAVYATFSHSFDRLSFMAGLRAEQVNITSNLITLDSIIPNNYFKIYPTLHLVYELNQKQELQLNYSKRVRRPDSDEMNPFPEYSDPRNMEAGNPLAKPEQIHSIEFGYHFKTDAFSLLSTMYYRYKYDEFTEIKEYVNDTVMLTTFTNLSKSEFTGMELVLSSNIGKKTNLNFNANGYYAQLDASNLGYSNKKSAFSWNAKLGTNYNFTKTTLFQFNCFYRSERINAQGKTDPSFYANLGLRQDILKNKASLIFTVSDIFNTMDKTYYIDTPELWQRSTRRRDSQIIYLGFTYKFGKLIRDQKQGLDFDNSL